MNNADAGKKIPPKKNIVVDVFSHIVRLERTLQEDDFLTILPGKIVWFEVNPGNAKQIVLNLTSSQAIENDCVLRSDYLSNSTQEITDNQKACLPLISTKYGEINTLTVEREITPNTKIVKFGIQVTGSTPISFSNKVIIKTRIKAPGYSPLITTPPRRPVVAAILDQFSYDCFKYDLNLILLTKENWKSEIDRFAPKFLFVESAWKGNSGKWRLLISDIGPRGNTRLRELVDYCKSKKIPTVFWNKEDPINFEKFIDAAKMFDYVFTTDISSVKRYRKICGHDRVFSLPFAAQPVIHNPIGKKEIDALDIAFAGSWYQQKHEVRSSLMSLVLEPSLQYHLVIFDRNYNLNNDLYRFPEKYRPFVNPGLPYEEIVALHRSFKIFVNTNSIINSATMFSRRVFEILASTTPVVSTESLGIQKMFDGIVPIVRTVEEAGEVINKFMSDIWYRKRTGHAGYRKVMLEHTYAHRVQRILKIIKVPRKEKAPPCITVITSVKKTKNLKRIRDNFSRQNYPNIEFILALGSGINIKKAREFFHNQPNIKIFQPSTIKDKVQTGIMELIEWFRPWYRYRIWNNIRIGSQEMTGQYLARMDEDAIYLENYITDLVIAANISKSEVVGKRSIFTYTDKMDKLAYKFPNKEFQYTDFIHGASMMISKEVLDKVDLPGQFFVNSDQVFLKSCIENGFKIFSADSFNMILLEKNNFRQAQQPGDQDMEVVSNGLNLDFVKA